MPRPVDPDRLLVAEIIPGSSALLSGEVRHADLADAPENGQPPSPPADDGQIGQVALPAGAK